MRIKGAMNFTIVLKAHYWTRGLWRGLEEKPALAVGVQMEFELSFKRSCICCKCIELHGSGKCLSFGLWVHGKFSFWVYKFHIKRPVIHFVVCVWK